MGPPVTVGIYYEECFDAGCTTWEDVERFALGSRLAALVESKTINRVGWKR